MPRHGTGKLGFANVGGSVGLSQNKASGPVGPVAYVDSNIEYWTGTHPDTLVHTLPTNNKDDLMMVLVASTVNTANPSSLSGWTRDANHILGGNGGAGIIYYKYSTGGESSVSIDSTRSGSIADTVVSIVFSGVALAAAGGPFDDAPAAGDLFHDSSGQSFSCVAKTSTVNGSLMCIGAFKGLDFTASTAPSGYTQHETILGGQSSICIASKQLPSAGAETPGAYTSTPSGEYVIPFSVQLLSA